jgi:hypothetical protein
MFLVLDLSGQVQPRGRIEYLEGQQIAGCIVVQDDAWLVLVALDNLLFGKRGGEQVGLAVVDYFYLPLPQYFSIRLVR